MLARATKAVVPFMILVLVACGSGNDPDVQDASSTDYLMQRLLPSTTEVEADGTPLARIEAASTASGRKSVPRFTFSRDDLLGDPICSALDHYIPWVFDPNSGTSGYNEVRMSPFWELRGIGGPERSFKILVGKKYHFIATSYIVAIDGTMFCNSQLGYQGCAKVGKCNFGGIAVYGDWNFTIDCPNSAQASIIKQTTRGDVFVEGTAGGTGVCTLTATAQALSDDGLGEKTFTHQQTFGVIDEDSTTPTLVKIEFDGKELPLNRQVDLNLAKLDYQLSAGEKAPGFTTAAGSACGGPYGKCSAFRAIGSNLTNIAWKMNSGILSGSGVEYYWVRGSAESVTFLATALNANDVMLQDRIFLYKK